MFLYTLTLTLALLPLSIAAPGTQRIDVAGRGIRAEDIQARSSDRNATRPRATWGLARISSGRSRLVKQDPRLREFDYKFNSRSLGNATRAFVISSGCNIDSAEIQNRTTNEGSFPPNVPPNVEPTDTEGFGTALATIVGGQTAGVAPEAKLRCIKVTKGDFTPPAVDDIAAGIDLAVQLASNDPFPSVILIEPVQIDRPEVDAAVARALAKEIPVISPAGNNRGDAKDISPARVDGVIVVGATDISDGMADDSNFGETVTLFAPGVNDLTRTINGSLVTVNGTAMAAGYVTGVALGLLSRFGQMPPDDLKQRLVKLAHVGVIGGIPPNTFNLLLNNGFST